MTNPPIRRRKTEPGAAVLALVLLCVSRTVGQTVEEPVNAPDPVLTAAHLYNGVGRPMTIHVAPPESLGPYRLLLLDAKGEALAGPLTVRPGRLDLGELMPAVWELRFAAYLQLFDREEPVGSALVLRPMISRLVPQTEQADRPDGSPYTRIVGWRDEALPPSPPPEDPEGEVGISQGDDDSSAPPEDQPENAPIDQTRRAGRQVSERPPDAAHITAESLAHEHSVFTGLQAYPEAHVVMFTDRGKIVIAMAPEEAPNTAWNFLRLCDGGFYRDVIFHRIVPLTSAGDPFVIQAGDPTATREGGAGWWLPLEPSRLPHDFGVISMARADDPDSAGSQFFIALSRGGTARLDGQYCSFGYVVSGADTIQLIASAELADVKTGKPVNPPVIWETQLDPAPPRVPGVDSWFRRVTLEQTPPAADRPKRVPR